jgi:hypothetical protein
MCFTPPPASRRGLSNAYTVIAAIGKAVANVVIALNSPGHTPTAETRARRESQFFQPADSSEAVIMGVTEIAVAALPLAARGSASTEVVHFTNAAGKAGIQADGLINAGSHVTKASEVRGLSSASAIERRLEIDPGKGAHSFTTTVRTRSLVIPGNGPKTSGGAWQRQLSEPAKIKKDGGS